MNVNEHDWRHCRRSRGAKRIERIYIYNEGTEINNKLKSNCDTEERMYEENDILYMRV
jgi:hypothetical protein